MMKPFVRLPCGGSITRSSNGDQIFRVAREMGNGERPVVFILCHPPAKGDDPEIERCLKFAIASGFGRLCILYLFPYRAGDLNDLRKRRDPTGPGVQNRRTQDLEIHMAINKGGRVFADWGPDGSYIDADKQFLARYDGSPRGFSPYRTQVFPIEVLTRAAVAA